MQELDRYIAEKYNFDVKNIVPYKDVHVINTSRGKKVLKKIPCLPDRILFIHGAKEHLYNNGFKNLDRYLCTVDGEPYINFDESYYTVTDFIEGSECNFDSRTEIIGASRLLASLHKASRGFVPPEGSLPRDELGKLPVYFAKRLDELKKLKKVAKKGRSKFDYLFLDYVDYFYNLGESTIMSIPEPVYYNLVASAQREGMFCHHDFTHHNIICSENRMSIINFDFCCFELKIYDIANFLRRKMRKCSWDIGEAKVIVDEYRTIEPISSDEFFIMRLIMQFPQKFWRVVNKYYNSKRSWSEKIFVSKLQEVIEELQYHKNFMEKFDMLMY